MADYNIGELDDTLFFPYNSQELVDPDGGGLGGYDREYDAQDWADYFKAFIGNGVFPNPSNNLLTTSLGGFGIRVMTGSAYINGRFYLQRKPFDFSVPASNPANGRIDIVIVRHDAINRMTHLVYREGVASGTPTRPAIIRDNDYYELVLAQITVGAGVTGITGGDILDTRLNSELCGIVHGVVQQVSTTDIFNQYYNFLQSRMKYWDLKDNEMEIYMQRIKDEALELLEEAKRIIYSFETHAFSLINNNFDELWNKRGCDLTSTLVKDLNGNLTTINEKIMVVFPNFELATRITAFEYDTQGTLKKITATINFNEWTFEEGQTTFLATRYQSTQTTNFNYDATGSLISISTGVL